MSKPSLHKLISVLGCLLLVATVGCQGALSRQNDKPAPVVAKVPATPDQLPVAENPPIAGSIPHDTNAFTQGFLFLDGKLYEGTGRVGQSRIRALNPDSGAVETEAAAPEEVFGEGLAFLDGLFYQLTWQSGVCLVYDRQLEFQKQLLYGTEGWGLTADPEKRQLIYSDGSSTIRFVDPNNLVTQRKIEVTDGNGRKVSQLNELEWVRGELWANVWMSDVVCRIDPATGKALGWIKFTDLVKQNQTSNEDVLNGLAYDPDSDTLWVTGKLWPNIYKVEKISETLLETDTGVKPPDKPQTGSPSPAR